MVANFTTYARGDATAVGYVDFRAGAPPGTVITGLLPLTAPVTYAAAYVEHLGCGPTSDPVPLGFIRSDPAHPFTLGQFTAPFGAGGLLPDGSWAGWQDDCRSRIPEGDESCLIVYNFHPQTLPTSGR
jgi:hypothetical protein